MFYYFYFFFYFFFFNDTATTEIYTLSLHDALPISLEVGHPRHGAVVVHHLADDPGGREAGEPAQVHATLGLAGAHQDAALARPEGKHVAGAHQVLRPGVGIDGGADGDRAVVRADPGGDALGGLDADGEGGAVGALVLVHHHAQSELLHLLLGERQADQPARMLGHEVDGFRGDELGRKHEVALVLAVGVVDQDHHATAAKLLEGFLHAGDVLFHSVAPQVRNCIRRATCLPRISASTFTLAPADLMPQVVERSVSGMRKSATWSGSSSSLTVSEVPSSAIEPFETTSGASPWGSRSSIRTPSPSPVRRTSSPTPSTWPRTRCPPRRSPSASGRSRLTRSPAFRSPRVVLSNVSALTSAVKRSPLSSTAVRHTPSTAMLAPCLRPSRRVRTDRRTPLGTRSTAATVPRSSISPVNIPGRYTPPPRVPLA